MRLLRRIFYNRREGRLILILEDKDGGVQVSLIVEVIALAVEGDVAATKPVTLAKTDCAGLGRCASTTIRP